MTKEQAVIEALKAAMEWSAAFPLQGTCSKPDQDAAAHVYNLVSLASLALSDVRASVERTRIAINPSEMSVAALDSGAFAERVSTEPVKKETSALRCRVTGNLCGTDTWMDGTICPCKSCVQWLKGASSQTTLPPMPTLACKSWRIMEQFKQAPGGSAMADCFLGLREFVLALQRDNEALAERVTALEERDGR